MVWSNNNLDVDVKVFSNVINIYDQLTLSKADYSIVWVDLFQETEGIKRQNQRFSGEGVLPKDSNRNPS